MKVASKPAWSFFRFFPIRESFLLLPIPEWEAAFIDFLFGFPLTRFPMVRKLLSSTENERGVESGNGGPDDSMAAEV
jgi:hypothetical protein